METATTYQEQVKENTVTVQDCHYDCDYLDAEFLDEEDFDNIPEKKDESPSIILLPPKPQPLSQRPLPEDMKRKRRVIDRRAGKVMMVNEEVLDDFRPRRGGYVVVRSRQPAGSNLTRMCYLACLRPGQGEPAREIGCGCNSQLARYLATATQPQLDELLGIEEGYRHLLDWMSGLVRCVCDENGLLASRYPAGDIYIAADAFFEVYKGQIRDTVRHWHLDPNASAAEKLAAGVWLDPEDLGFATAAMTDWRRLVIVDWLHLEDFALLLQRAGFAGLKPTEAPPARA